MNLRSMIFREIWHRPTSMLTSLLAVTFGVTALVAIQNITVFSERQIANDMESLGANVLVLPPDVTLQDYYASDTHGKTFPEEFVTRLALARLAGVDNLAPKLCVKSKLGGSDIMLAGLLPKSEFQAKAAWQGIGMFDNPVGSARGCCSTSGASAKISAASDLATNRTVDQLGKKEVILGSDLAQRVNAIKGQFVSIAGREFKVIAVLKETGAIDDSRAFAHLHTVQDIAKSGPVVNVIEIMACCDDAAGSLISELQSTLPETRIVTINQIVETQVAVNRLMSKLSWVFFAILLLIGAASIASVMFANVAERRKEIGTLMAIGASHKVISRLILGKALLLGSAGGVSGFLLGSLTAVILGPQLLSVKIEPLPQLLLIGTAASVAVSLTASYLPARRAATLDPCLVFNNS